MKRIVCVGGGPAGLYSAILLKKALPHTRVEVYERNRPADTFGWGVVFSDQTMENFKSADAPSHAAIVAGLRHWDDIAIYLRGEHFLSHGHGFSGIGRVRLLSLLQERAAELAVHQTFQHEVTSDDEFADADLIIAADGVNSATRNRYPQIFEPDVDVRKCRFMWLGTTQEFSAFTFAFEETHHGWFQIHAYQFSRDMSTVIVETREETWKAHGLDRADTPSAIAFCEQLFAAYLGGHKLQSNAGHLKNPWLNFHRVLCKRWHHGRIALIGDAAHTAHFSIGSGTKLAMEDAISIARHTAAATDLAGALATYQEERSIEVLKLQSAARNRMEWFENVARHTRLPPRQFAYSLLTGSQRIGHENLKLRDRAFVEDYERWLAGQYGADVAPRPPMFLPLALRGLTLANRVIVSPMAQYMARDGLPGEWHLVHYGSRALGGAGLIFTEMTCVSAEGRISKGCTGLWNEAQREAWARIVSFVHENSETKFCLQLGHSGRKGSTQLGWQEPDHPLDEGNWTIYSPSAEPYLEGLSQKPKPMTRPDMDKVREDFVRATRFGEEAGFDMLELHMAHGYLLASFLSPLTNRRTDEYGGSIENRVRFPLEVFTAVRAAWPQDKPISVRISATDWAPGGLSEEDALFIARAMQSAGADIIDVSTGQTVASQAPVYGRMWQTPFADRIRNEVGIATIAVGSVYEPDHVNSIVAAGRADLCAIARPHLANSAWTLEAAAQQGYAAQWWPEPYRSAKNQLERNLARAAQIAGPV
jgi:anthraniloyl-CoA monooxygenase